MKITAAFRTLVVLTAAAALAAGCATAPKEKPAEQPAPAPKQAGPSPAALQAIAEAEAAIKEAKALHWIWRDTEKFLKKAKKAAKKGDNAKAIKLARKAKEQAELAVNQYYLEEAKFMIEELKGRRGLNADQQARLRQAEEAYRNAEGRRAYDLASALLEELRNATIQYTVVRGDSLWKIAGKPEIYGNPYEWPLIYKANADQIRDADLIYPGQVFDIDMNPSPDEVAAAIRHAKTRGAWALGVVEESDKAYLAR